MENEIENADSTNSEEITDTVETESDNVEELKKQNQSLYEQLKKAKGFERGEDGKWIKKSQTKEEAQTVATQKPVTGLSQLDTVAIIRGNVHEDDVATVADYARLKGITISEALKTSVIKTILSENNEKRSSASASNTGGARRGALKPTDEELIERAERNQLPDDVEALARARMSAKKAKK